MVMQEMTWWSKTRKKNLCKEKHVDEVNDISKSRVSLLLPIFSVQSFNRELIGDRHLVFTNDLSNGQEMAPFPYLAT